jgi:hypothetical protein
MINSKANELFFYGVSRSICYFVSDREGGKGGLDIYEGNFNPFLPGYGSVRVKIMDTTTNRLVPGRLEVTEKRFGNKLLGEDIDSVGGGNAWLYAGYPYSVFVEPTGFDTSVTLQVEPLAAEEEREYVIELGSPPPPPPPAVPVVDVPSVPPSPPGPPQLPPGAPSTPPAPPVVALDFAGINVPLFVSGYYRLNTLLSLEDLKQRQQDGGDLAGRTYIEDVAHNPDAYRKYKDMAADVEEIIGDFYRRCLNQYFPAFDSLRDEGEYLELTVYGYADPRPILGQFGEDMEITFETSDGIPWTVRKGSEMDNFRLAGLRAWFAVQHLDKLFRDAAKQGNDVYVRLRNDNAVRWRIVSGNVDEVSGNTLADKRRIHVTVQPRGGDFEEPLPQ